MQRINSLDDLDRTEIVFDDRWAIEKPSLSMHSIHAYPAKFPPFLASEAFNYAIDEKVNIDKVADIFCGCGTTALESKERGVSFWGCDINPVAVMITKAKTADYDLAILEKQYEKIIKRYHELKDEQNDQYESAKERLKYWYDEKSFYDLFHLYNSIKEITGESHANEYQFFQCVFSSILKACSRWLQKSIKPQIDKAKRPANVIKEFSNKYTLAFNAVKQMNNRDLAPAEQIEIEECNFLECNNTPKVDLIITSPPYVTSYEYADLHQLSSLWLNYADDYRDLRKGTIGSGHISERGKLELTDLNKTAKSIYDSLTENKCIASKRNPVAIYYYEMQQATKKCFRMLNKNGMIVFVIGDSELAGVKLSNARHLVETMITEGFSEINICKRKVSKGICVPYRDTKGKFTRKEKASNEIYHEEYVISGRKR